MVDIHTHILPGIDDGAQDIYDTLDMAKMAADIGVTSIVATPHCNIPGMFDNYFGEEYIEVYKRASEAVRREGIPVQILPGMEAFATYDLPELIVNKKIMPLNSSRYILMEFPFDEDPEYATDLLERVKNVGARPVVAHVERYDFIQDDPQIAYMWRQKGYVLQVNKSSFLGRFGQSAQITASRLLRHNLIAAVASDAHGPIQRTTYLLDAYEELCTEYSRKYIDVLFQENPERICNNKPVLMRKPVRFEY